MTDTNRDLKTAGERAKAYAGLAKGLNRAETCLGLLRAELDPSVVADLGRRIADARIALDRLRGIGLANGAQEITPFWRKFLHFGDSGEIVSP